MRGMVLSLLFAGSVLAQSERRGHPSYRSVGDRQMRKLPHSRRARKHAAYFLGADYARRLAGSAETNDPGGWRDAHSSPRPATIVKYLSLSHGLAPEEAKPVMYDVERRMHHGNRHSERRHWTRLREMPLVCPIAFLAALARRLEAARRYAPHTLQACGEPGRHRFSRQAAPLHTPAWDAWSARARTPNLAGRWLVTASMQGRGMYYGEMQVEGTGDEFNTSVHLTSVRDGSTIIRSGRGVDLWSVRLARTFPRRLVCPRLPLPMIRTPIAQTMKRARSCGWRPINLQRRVAGFGDSIRNSAST